MKIALCQLNPIVGDIEGNLKKAEAIIENINYRRADLFVFPELFITGYPPRDLLDHTWFIQQAGYALDRLCMLSKSIPEKALITGAILPNTGPYGRALYNSAVCIMNGKILFAQHKSLLPSYDVFDEHRYFEPASEHGTFVFKDTRIGITICEDMWARNTHSFTYEQNPVHELKKCGAELIINISASPYYRNKSQQRLRVIQDHARSEKIPFILVNTVGANDELIFDGGSTAVNAHGVCMSRLPFFEEALEIVDMNDTDTVPIHTSRTDDYEELRQALVLGIQDYFSKSGFTHAFIGLSGGIDSAVTAALAVQALGKENVRGITMPSKYSSPGSIDDSRSLASNLGISMEEISIGQIHTAFEEELAPHFSEFPPNTAEENVQSRIRGALLMAFANKFGALVLNTGNKSEMAVGYCTLYGDMNGALSILADLYKTEVFALAHHLNTMGECIPENTLSKPPSAELREEQLDQDTLPPYDLLDEVLFALLEEDQSSEDLISKGIDPQIVHWIIRSLQINEYKRRQAPPVLKVTPKAFGMGRRFPIVSKYEW
ncbi:NAD+ synthase [Chitinivibrio alkaliphilus]|uniref:Glutamine-dependent NAD(+) synthetase n=1 Tax=Chitinivibrio alkaliphilus ACht1 TaxID=1313304 RepID=U7D8M3_9BACT|nr:NAD+ synthase [Chitinivibrio alkaliphilus]ERP31442.1 NAD+ synthetase [Chitinivibrio alkaliphilus ACht1]